MNEQNKYETSLKLKLDNLEKQIKELKEKLEIAEKHIAISGLEVWDSYIEETRAY